AATQRGRALQPAFMMSRNRSAVVAGSTVTSLSSGGGGTTAVFHSEMTSAADGDPSHTERSAPAAAATRDDAMGSSLDLGGRGKSDRVARIRIEHAPGEGHGARPMGPGVGHKGGTPVFAGYGARKERAFAYPTTLLRLILRSRPPSLATLAIARHRR